uniref:Pentacotripeptide-repeat region of PRORP domain-containing protein n=1 Tax=Amorphochlora amoebiformis TaxID=1561963 RepID=A0A6T6TW57_9EUKA|mmetsp:Transcript_19677/g.31236  ORF Transcript_19677/g.31236 Transcript_19677/m.31236 type:complete len:164 (+) Transcript_19677:492-983(+)
MPPDNNGRQRLEVHLEAMLRNENRPNPKLNSSESLVWTQIRLAKDETAIDEVHEMILDGRLQSTRALSDLLRDADLIVGLDAYRSAGLHVEAQQCFIDLALMHETDEEAAEVLVHMAQIAEQDETPIYAQTLVNTLAECDENASRRLGNLFVEMRKTGFNKFA